MNIAEIRKKVRAERVAHEIPVATPLSASLSLLEEAPFPELSPQGATYQPLSPFASTAAEVAAGSASGEERLDRLFSWPACEDEILGSAPESGPAVKEREAANSRRWLAFSLGNEDYALDISVIQEIIKPREITEIPRVPEWLLGIISLRGHIVPVFDLKRRLGLGETIIDQESTRIIVCQKDDRSAGLLVDRITQVTSILDERIEPTPAIFSGRDLALLDGVGRTDGDVLILLNITNVLTLDVNGL